MLTKESKLTGILIEGELCGCISRIRFSMMLPMVSGVLDTSLSFGSSYRLAVFKCNMVSATALSCLHHAEILYYTVVAGVPICPLFYSSSLLLGMEPTAYDHSTRCTLLL